SPRDGAQRVTDSGAALAPASGAQGLARADVVAFELRASTETGVWTAENLVAWRGAAPESVTLWAPSRGEIVDVRVDGVPTDAWHLATAETLVVGPLPANASNARATVVLRGEAAGRVPTLVVPADAATLRLRLGLPPGTGAPASDAFSAEGERLGLVWWGASDADVAAGTRIALALAGAPTVGPKAAGLEVLAVVAGLAVVLLVAGRAWTARKVPPPTEATTLLGHLREIQQRLLVAAVPFALLNVVFFTIGIGSADLGGRTVPVPVLDVERSIAAGALTAIAAHVVPPGVELVVLRPFDAVLAEVQVALFLALLATVPLAAHQMGAFFAPALHDRERRLVASVVPVVTALFVVGAVFAYMIMVPVMMGTLYGYAGALGVATLLSLGDMVSFALVITALFGFAFELPVVMVALVRLGLATPEWFARKWKHAIVIIFLAAGIVTPDPSVVSQFLVGVPLVALYGVGLAAARWAGRGRTGA
ncbi:MAG TPA: twin-arginine translocase subunit TatC, partial [Candidatus Thermoplasmatota archaeon]|nr:twin-arginine translocase subunit TatC [Candidatus Thermoplasmatota archaeon]